MTNFSTLLSQPLPDSDIHICCVSLNVASATLANHFSCLSLDEKAR
jgi:hypothetical protein